MLQSVPGKYIKKRLEIRNLSKNYKTKKLNEPTFVVVKLYELPLVQKKKRNDKSQRKLCRYNIK